MMRRGLEEGASGLGYSMTPILSHEAPRTIPRSLIQQRPPRFPLWSGRMSAGGDGLAAVAGGPALHIPVLGSLAVELLNVHDCGTYIDATFGAGGYTRGILVAAKSHVIGIDRDQHAIALGADLVQAENGRLTLIEDQFSSLDVVTRSCGFEQVDGVVLDLGGASMQLDTPERGFSCRHDGPLD